jgi:hypothetical protein
MSNTFNATSYDPSEKRLSFVYNSEITGFQPLDFGKLNNVEDVLINFSGFGINVHQDDLNPITDSVSVSGRLYEVISGFDTFGINVHQDDLNVSTDSVTAVPEKGGLISNYTPSGINATILAGNSARKQLYIQNLATGTLYVKYGSSAGTNSFNFVLGGASYLSGGNGGILSDLGYTGIVSVCSGLGTGPVSPNYIDWEKV